MFGIRHNLLLLVALTALGCKSSSVPAGQAVPKEAVQVVEQKGRLLFAARNPGMVFVANEDKRVIFKTPVIAGDKFVFYPERKQYLVNGKVVAEDPKLSGEHVYQLYFLQSLPGQ